MKIAIPFDFGQNQQVFMRRAGYSAHHDPNTGQSSYTKRLTRDYYPRFHVYIETTKDNQEVINLHLDQKKPSYAGAHAHNAEYDGGQVEQEGARLSGLIKNQMDNQAQVQTKEKKKGFFSKLFN